MWAATKAEATAAGLSARLAAAAAGPPAAELVKAAVSARLRTAPRCPSLYGGHPCPIRVRVCLFVCLDVCKLSCAAASAQLMYVEDRVDVRPFVSAQAT